MVTIHRELVQNSIAPSGLGLGSGEDPLEEDKIVELAKVVVGEWVSPDNALAVPDELALAHLVLDMGAGEIGAEEDNGKTEDGHGLWRHKQEW